MQIIYICSPYTGDIETNTIKAQEYCRWACKCRNVRPLAPHLHDTQFLEDCVKDERELGLKLGLILLEKCDELWAFGNYISKGMQGEIDRARELGMKIRHFDHECKLLSEEN